jgi:hypothetical protein
MLFEAAGTWIVAQQDFSRHHADRTDGSDRVSFNEFDDYLRDLERINVLTLAYRPTQLWLKRALTAFPAERPISVLDVVSSGGCTLRQLRKWASGKNLKFDLARFPQWKFPLLRSAKEDRSPARQQVGSGCEAMWSAPP